MLNLPLVCMYAAYERITLITKTAAFTAKVSAVVFDVHETPCEFHGQAVAIGFGADCSLPLSARDCTAKPMADRLNRRKRQRHFSFWAAEVTAVTALPQMGSPESRRLSGERRSNGASEPCCLQRGEGYGVCDDAEPTVLCSRQDESTIVGYYTSAEVPPRSPCPLKSLLERSVSHGKK
jgi:hypothetical protein